MSFAGCAACRSQQAVREFDTVRTAFSFSASGSFLPGNTPFVQAHSSLDKAWDCEILRNPIAWGAWMRVIWGLTTILSVQILNP